MGLTETAIGLLPHEFGGPYRRGILPLAADVDDSKPSILIVPGFLSDRKDLEYGPQPLSVIEHGGAISWCRRFLPILRQVPANFYLVNWPSTKLRSMLLSVAIGTLLSVRPFGFLGGLASSIQRFRKIWLQTVISADKTAKGLFDAFRGRLGSVLIIGHSLGGRIALRMCEHAGALGLAERPKAIAFAPAVCDCELNWSSLADYSPEEIEVFFSKSDKVLRFLFSAGRLNLTPALGLKGVPLEHEKHIGVVDATERPYRSKRGHSDYEPDVLLLLNESRLWTSMFPMIEAPKLAIEPRQQKEVSKMPDPLAEPHGERPTDSEVSPKDEKEYALAKLIDWFTRIKPGGVEAYVGKLRSQNEGISDDDLAKLIVRRKSLKNGFVGAVTGLGGFFTMPVTVPADLVASWRIQVFMACSVACVYGHTAETTDLRTDIYLIMAGDAAKEMLKRLGVEVAKSVTKKMVQKYVTREVMKKIWSVVGRKVITKAGQKSFTSIMKMIPGIGAPIGFAFDYLAARTVGRFAIKYYSGRG